MPSIDDDNDIVLAVYISPNYRQSGPMNDTWGDAARLQEIGARTMQMAFASALFRRKPNLPATQIEQQLSQLTQGPKLDEWLDFYNLKRYLTAPGDPIESRNLFETVVGAVWYVHGVKKTSAWLEALANGETYVKEEEDGTQPPLGGPSFSNTQGQPPQYTPPFTDHSSNSPPPSPEADRFMTVALLNERASQARRDLKWVSASIGQPHIPQWTVQCLVDGQEVARASGTSVKKAKEAAAPIAFRALGWA